MRDLKEVYIEYKRLHSSIDTRGGHLRYNIKYLNILLNEHRLDIMDIDSNSLYDYLFNREIRALRMSYEHQISYLLTFIESMNYSKTRESRMIISNLNELIAGFRISYIFVYNEEDYNKKLDINYKVDIYKFMKKLTDMKIEFRKSLKPILEILYNKLTSEIDLIKNDKEKYIRSLRRK